MKNKETLYIIGAGIVGFFAVRYGLQMMDEKQSSVSGHTGYQKDAIKGGGYQSDVMLGASGDCGCS